MIKSIRSAYKAGYRAGRTAPRIITISFQRKELQFAICPFAPWRLLCYTAWHQGNYNGSIERLTGGIRI